MSETDNGWKDWSKHVLHELSRLKESSDHMRQSLDDFKLEISKELAKKTEVETLQKEIVDMKLDHIRELSSLRQEMMTLVAKEARKSEVETATLKTELSQRAGVWGAMAGAIPAVIALIYYLIK